MKQSKVKGGREVKKNIVKEGYIQGDEESQRRESGRLETRGRISLEKEQDITNC